MFLQRGPCEAGEVAVRVGCRSEPGILGHGKICTNADKPSQVRIMLFIACI